ncbi:MAG TPA: FkbM family methyltransferase [Lacipirellulaceae bacterium]|nr:FkbM family methyltransferase [Lacipirellulaceae bacterium]HMP05460.1 FkbM family methyltransferase [Lacipirellulaceae bacterium]
MNPVNIIRSIVSGPLNQGRPVRALWRFAKWQVGSRLAPGPIVVPWVNGTRFIASPGERGVTVNIYNGLYEFADMAYVLHVLRHEDWFLDVGANVGSYTLLACGAAGAQGYAFEPVPSTFERLVANLRLNGLEGRVRAVNQGLGDNPTTLRFSTERNCTNHVLAEDERVERSVEVSVTTLDAVADHSPAMMKIDVEGFEMPVLRGASRVLADPTLNSLLIELNGSGARYGFDDSELVDLLESYGFRPYQYEPFQRRLAALEQRHNEEGNTLFVRDLARARERVESAAPFSIFDRQI